MALDTLHPAGIRPVSSWVPPEALQIHPPASLMPTTTPELLMEPNDTQAEVAPAGRGITVAPEVVPMNARLLPSPFTFSPNPATWPESLIASPYDEPQPAGKGITVLPDVVPMNACRLSSTLRTYPVT